MKLSSKVRIYKGLKKLLKPETIQVVIVVLIMSVPIHKRISSDEAFDLMTLFDLEIFISIVLAFLTSNIAVGISKIIGRNLEDHIKLNSDYSNIANKYPMSNKMISYSNCPNSNYELGRRKTSSKRSNDVGDFHDTYKFPITLEAYCKGYRFEIIDSLKQYSLPSRIRENYDDIMSAHSYSSVYNQLTIRLDDYRAGDGLLELYTSRTSYYDSLVTNRALDYKLNSNISVRDIYEYGPFLNELSESSLSNHIGFHVFVETCDGKIIFVERFKDVSVGKNTLGNSIQASLKTKYALDKDGNFSLDGLVSGVKLELEDELSIGPNDYEFSLENNTVSLYRDIVEGGKPLFLFYIKVNTSFDQVNGKFKDKLSKNNKDKKLINDGEKLVYVDKDKLTQIYITPDIIVIDNKTYKVTPSASAAMVMLIEHLKNIYDDKPS